MATDELTAPKAAYRLTHLLNQVADAQGRSRFPVDIDELALEAHRIFGWSDPIARVEKANIPSFEGALIREGSLDRWVLLYNDRLTSAGRIRFTQAHELGHYLLHRGAQSVFQCSEDDTVGITADYKKQEGEADTFAATLLMPLDDFRAQTNAEVNLDVLRGCSEKYGVSLTAAVLRWIESTGLPAVAISHRDGFMRWAKSSKAAMKAGAFFKTRSGPPVEIPSGSLASDALVDSELIGEELDARTWFRHATHGQSLTEMKLTAHNYDWCLTVLVLPRNERVWAPREFE
jgi:Zn-dependent peptidase ImmA (M78 family)